MLDRGGETNRAVLTLVLEEVAAGAALANALGEGGWPSQNAGQLLRARARQR